MGVSALKVKSPLKYPGGQGYLTDWLLSLFPPRDEYLTYLEPFAGGLNVLLAHDGEGKSEVVNDRNGPLTNFWRTLACPERFPEFARLVEVTPFCADMWGAANCMMEVFYKDVAAGDFEAAEDKGVWAAVQYFLCCRQSMMGLGKTFAPLTTARVRRGMNEQASAWWSAVEGLAGVHARLGRVVILNEDGVGLIAKYDKPGVLIMADPPFDAEARTPGLYACEFDGADHARLVKTLVGVRHAKVMLCGYPTPLYEPLEAAGWGAVTRQVPNSMAKGGKKVDRPYTVWRNY